MRARARALELASAVSLALLVAATPAHAQSAATPAPPSSSPPADAQAPGAPTEVRVIGDKADALQKIPGSGELITGREIERANPVDTSEMLRRVPGVSVVQDESGGLRMDIGIRGLDATRGRRVLLLEDGVPLEANLYGEPDLYFAPAIERMRGIEIVKGSGSILFGPQTIGGVINFLTVAPPSDRIARLEVDGGSYDFMRVLARYGDHFERGSYVVQIFDKRGSGVRDEPYDMQDFLGKVSLDTSEKGTVTVKIGYHAEHANSTTAGFTEAMYEAYKQGVKQPLIAPFDHVNADRLEISATHRYDFDVNTNLITIAYATGTYRYFRREDYGRNDPTPPPNYIRVVGDPSVTGGAIYFRDSDNIMERNFEMVGLEPRFEHRFDTGGVGHTIDTGARVLYEYGGRSTREGQSPTATQGDNDADESHETIAVAAYAQDRLQFNDWILVTPGIRFEDVNFTRTFTRDVINGVPQDEDIQGTTHVDGFIPGVGMVMGTPEAHAFGGVHQGWAPPRVTSAIGGTGQDQLLDAEKSIEYELGARTTPLKWLHGELTGFLLNFSNQIVSIPGGPGMSGEANGGQTQHYGVEAFASVGLGTALKLPVVLDIFGNYTFSHAKFVNGEYRGNYLPLAPLHTGVATMDVGLPKTPMLEVSWTHISSQFSDELNTVKGDATGTIGEQPAHDIVDAGVRYHEPTTRLTFSVSMKNVLNSVYIASRKPDGIFVGEPRSVYGGVRWDYEAPH